MATATATLSLPEDLAIRYDRLAKSTGRTKTFYMTEALAAEIDRLECEYGLLKKVEDYRAGRLGAGKHDGLANKTRNPLAGTVQVRSVQSGIPTSTYTNMPILS